LVLLILAVIWAAVLIPPFLRVRAEGRPADSITDFHRQLSVLRRAGPRVGGQGDFVPGLRGPSAGPESSYSGRHVAPYAPSRPSLAPVARPAFADGRHASFARRNARRRRRDILMTLLVAAGTTLVLGAIPALRMLWLVHAAADVLLFGYVALLIRQRNLATERELKVRLLPTARRHEARLEAEGRWVDGESGWLAEPALLRQSAT
jgi:hypothetical protein